MPNSPRAILDRMTYKGAMTQEERDKIERSLIPVRCEKCAHWDIDNANAGESWCFALNRFTYEEDYCSLCMKRGKRSEEE